MAISRRGRALALGRRTDYAPGSAIHHVPSGPGTLRAAIAYPHPIEVYNSAVVAKALAEVGLERLVPLLDTVERWDHRLTDEEKQSLAIGRVILQKPSWVVLNGALDGLDPAARGRIEALFSGYLANIGIINIGHADREAGLYARTLHVASDPRGPST